ncbi:hypothetical protein CC1G_14788 [Coprinopsis cinerea okayama7|uniref:Uncharacterized protein n=1 Tax=Coprinopsis cinerea (strain Okayama-7 / 130 / ATCC MYA-4618 / FGSC 9003) TaxID=240176 RepID=D6RNG9_COPC7|nr:hypothetical protein CC1G_14788 [Coprinopsis cinerea okayama7\|eukprot:XP_002910810.1 hypothetical protein CC1G_14788 [Coprinopsis cinerea okayama7\
MSTIHATHDGWSLPREIVFKIIDHIADERRRRPRGSAEQYTDFPCTLVLRNLALTCRSLSDYCHPIIFAEITVRDRERPGSDQFAFTTKRWAKLLDHSHGVARRVNSLVISIGSRDSIEPLQSWSSSRRKWNRLTRRYSLEAARKAFLKAVQQDYPCLEQLNIQVVAPWPALLAEVQEGIMKLLRTSTLSRLKLDLSDFPLERLRLCCNIQQLMLTTHLRHHPFPRPVPTGEESPGFRLELKGLYLFGGYVSGDALEGMISESSPLNLTECNHIRLPIDFMSSFSSIHAKFLEHAPRLTTLDLIFRKPKDQPRLPSLQVPLNLATLPALEVLSITVENPTEELHSVCHWLSCSAGTIPATSPSEPPKIKLCLRATGKDVGEDNTLEGQDALERFYRDVWSGLLGRAESDYPGFRALTIYGRGWVSTEEVIRLGRLPPG